MPTTRRNAQGERIKSFVKPRTTIGGVARGGSLAVLMCVALATTVFARSDADARRVVPLAIPAATANKPRWDEERTVFAAKLVRGYGLEATVANEFAGWILEASVRQQLAPELLASLVMAESSFRKHVRSSFGAIGPAQVRPDYWSAFCGNDLLDPEQNVYCGAQILAYYQDVCARRTRNPGAAEACALRSYNVGYYNRDNVYFAEAATRYLAKIDRYRSPLADPRTEADA